MRMVTTLARLGILLLVATPALAQTPELTISDSVAPEGDSGLTPFTFTVSLSAPANATVLVKWATTRCTARPKEPCATDGDYLVGDGVLEFPPGTVSRTLTVDVVGDTNREGQEVFFVGLSDPVNAVLASLPQGQGQGIILNDDGPLPAPPRADFNGDGRTDIVWRHQSSQRVVVWLMDGLDRVTGAYVTVGGTPAAASAAADSVGTADFDHDGDADLLFHDPATGTLEYWYLQGLERIGVRTRPGQEDLGWRVAGTADFDGDGRPDILWRHETTGRMQVWFMDDRTQLAAADLDPAFVPTLGDPTAPDLNWRVAGLGDFDGDGRTDLLFRHQVSRRLVFWLLDGVHRTAGGYLDPDRPADHEAWDLAGVWDVDQEGIADVVFRNVTSGALVAWFLDDAQRRICGTYFNPPALADFGWRMVGPR